MAVSSGKPILLLLIALSLPVGAFAADVLSIEIWCELQPMAFEPDADNSANEADALTALFEEARLVFSGMIYGYRFTYIPLDKTRGVKELFTIEPIAEITRGDKRLALVSADAVENRLYGRFLYTLEEFQEARLESWRTVSLPAETGRGESRLIDGPVNMKASREQSIKQAVRNYLRPKIFNKPREVQGEALFLESPLLNISGGAYVTTAKVKINIKKIIPYTVP